MKLEHIISPDAPVGRHKHIVTLTPEERTRLRTLTTTGRAAARLLTHARILLQADAAPGSPGWTDTTIAEALQVSIPTIERVRRQFVEVGLDAALHRRRRTEQRLPLLDGRAEAHLIALACGDAPEGRARWTLRLLAAHLVTLEVVDTVSYETVRRVLKKTTSSRG